MNYIKLTFFFLAIFELGLTLNPQNTTVIKAHEYTYSNTKTKTPYEKEKDALKEALYCNADKMESGDSCYCGRAIFSCCASKDKCTGSFTRSCSQKVDDFQCDSQVTQGLAYWQETQNLKELIKCSNKYYGNTSSVCKCGKISISCCYSKSNCDIGTFSENCNKETNEASCDAEMQANRKQVKPKYYKVYFDLFSSSPQQIVNCLGLALFILIVFQF